MSMVAPKARKHLSADALFHVVRSGFANIPEPGCEEGGISLTDTLMSAFAMFSLKAPSLLAFDKERAESNLHTIFEIQHVPCGTVACAEHPDPVSPRWLRPMFQQTITTLQHHKALEAMMLLDAPLPGRPQWHRSIFQSRHSCAPVCTGYHRNNAPHHMRFGCFRRHDHPSRRACHKFPWMPWTDRQEQQDGRR